MTLEKDFEDFVSLLNQYKVEYMVVGGYALAFHGRPRHTGDLDIWINISPQNAKLMTAVIRDFGMGSLGLKEADFLKPGYVTQIGQPPLRIDILNNIDNLEFNEAKKNLQVLDVDGQMINYIGLHDFITNKQATGRKQDISDVKELKKILEKKDRPLKRKRSRGI